MNIITAPLKLASGETVLIAKIPHRTLRRPGATDHAVQISERVRASLRNERVRSTPIIVTEGELSSSNDLPFYGPAELCGLLAKAHRRGQLNALMWSPMVLAD